MDLALGDTRLIIDACKANGSLRNQTAYVLATAYHETAHTMKPITEYGSRAYLESQSYWPFIGRGYVQLTWKANYEKASGKVGADLAANPQLALDPRYAAPILVLGMTDGWFTGKKLADYITLQASDFIGARRIINGTDRAELIAGYAREYDALLAADGYGVAPNATPAPQARPSASVQPDPAPAQPAAPTAAPVPPVAAPEPAPPSSKTASGIAVVLALIAMGVAGGWHDLIAWLHGFF